MRARLVVACALVALAGACEGCDGCSVGERESLGPATQACPVPADKQALVGTWRADDFVLAVAHDCRVHYQRNFTSVRAPLQEFYGADFTVGGLGLRTTFKVSAPPHAVDGEWKMTVDGVELTKTDEAPLEVIEAAERADDD